MLRPNERLASYFQIIFRGNRFQDSTTMGVQVGRPGLLIGRLPRMSRLYLAGLFWLVIVVVFTNRCEASRAKSCAWVDWMPNEMKARCCGQGRAASDSNSVLTNAFESQTTDVIAAMACTNKLAALDQSRNPQFPMECCSVKPYSFKCRQERFNQRTLSRQLKQSLRSRSSRCSGNLIAKCCPSSRRQTSPSQRPRILDWDTNNSQCALGLLLNIVNFNWTVPQVCCSVPIFEIFCGSPPPDPPNPVQGPEPNSKPDPGPNPTQEP